MQRAVLASLLALLVVALIAPGAGASPQPVSICSVCGDGFEDAASDHGVDAEIEHLAVEVYVDENGDADWTVEMLLTNRSSADELRGDPDRLHEIANDSFENRAMEGPWIGDVSDLDATVEDRTVVKTFEQDEFAERTDHGALRIDYFHSDDNVMDEYTLRADEFTIVGPEGTVVRNSPAQGEVDGAEITFTDGYISDTYVVFAEDDLPGLVKALAATALPHTSYVTEALLLFAIIASIPTAMVGLLSIICRRSRSPWSSPEQTSSAVAVLGVVGLVPVFALDPTGNNGLVHILLAIIVTYLLAAFVVRWRSDPGLRWFVAVPVVALGATYCLLVGLAAVSQWGLLVGGFSGEIADVPSWIFVLGLLWAIPTALLLPAGYAAVGSSLRVRIATVGAFGVALTVLPVTWGPGAISGPLAILVVPFLIVFIGGFMLLLGLPLWFLGASAAAAESEPN